MLIRHMPLRKVCDGLVLDEINLDYLKDPNVCTHCEKEFLSCDHY
jgi:hypothetical protein